MKKEQVLKELREIIEKAGYSNCFTVTENINELGDFMIYRDSKHNEYLGKDGMPLFRFETIEAICYVFGEDKEVYDYVGNDFKIWFDLWDNASWVFEMGNWDAIKFYYNRRWHTDEDYELNKKLNEYNAKFENEFTQYRVWYEMINAKAEATTDEHEIDEESNRRLNNGFFKYLENSKCNELRYELLFKYTDSAIYCNTCHKLFFDIPRAMNLIIQNGLQVKYLDFIRKKYHDESGVPQPDAQEYTCRLSLALKYLDEYEAEENSKPNFTDEE